MPILDWISGRVFTAVHRNNLVYNTCWEDPRLDRIALDFQPDDDVMVITSAGCNALDYAATGPRHVYAVDMNPRQNALLELKKIAIKQLEYEDFFLMFGEGRLPGVQAIYASKFRPNLSEWAQNYWDKRIRFFDNKRRTFYYRGTSGSFARFMRVYIDRVIRARHLIEKMLDAKSIEEQREIYYKELKDKVFSRAIRFMVNRDTTMSMLGVPKAQRRQIENQYPGGLVKFIEDCVSSVFAKIPIHDNYFWRVYVNGSYTKDCCPEYLKPDVFQSMKDGLVDRITTNTCSVQQFLEKHDGTISKFILLDHMDWLSDKFFPALEAEWQAIVDKAAPGARAIWRSGGLRTDFLDDVQVNSGGFSRPLPELLTYNEELSTELHQKDRVHTYGCFYIADLNV